MGVKNRRDGNTHVEQERQSIGIDVSQDYLDMAAYPSRQVWRYKNNRSGIAKTVAKLVGVGPKIVVMEATGGLERNLRQALDEAGLAVAVVNPKRIRDHGRSMGILAKTDKLDAAVMAHFAAKIEPSPQAPRDMAELALDSLVTRRSQLCDMLTAERNRLKEHLDRAVQADVREHIEWLEAKIAGLDKEVQLRVRQNSSFTEKDALYQSMPGVGDVLSSTLIAKLPELGRLNQREIAALVGLAPVNRDSGKFRGRRMIQGGRAMVRKALYMPVVCSIRFNPVIRQLYLRLITKGKLKKVALTACMHKMLTILNAMAKTNTAWRQAPVA